MTLSNLGSWIVVAGAVVSLGFAPVASADAVLPQPGSESALDTINAYKASGFDVQINWLEGHPNVPLGECKVDDIHNPNGPTAGLTTLSTVYIDVSCPNAK